MRQGIWDMMKIVLPFAIVNFLIIGGGIALLATSSWLGAVLFGISAKDSIITYTPPIIILSLGITIAGSFLNHKLPTSHKTRRKPSPIRPLTPAPTPPPNLSTHVLVPGGKEAEETPQPQLEQATVLTAEAPATREHYEDMGERVKYSWSTSKWGSKRNDRPPLTGPPDKIQPRIDAISFKCQECHRTLSLPAQKAKTIIDRGELEIDCPYCSQHYPFNYDQAQKKLLTVSFRGVLGEEIEEKPRKTINREPIQTFEEIKTFEEPETKQLQTVAVNKVEPPNPLEDPVGSTPSQKGLLAAFTENPVGETTKALKTSSKVLVGSLVNNRIFQTVASRLQPNSSNLLGEIPSPGQYKHLLVPGGKEGESLTMVVPTIPNKWAPPSSSNPIDPMHATFEDMSDWLTPGDQPQSIPNPAQLARESIAIPDRLAIEIDSFAFNCGTCFQPIRLPWATVERGTEIPPFHVDCNNCHNTLTFNYEQAKRKTLNLRFKPYFELANPVSITSPAQHPIMALLPQSIMKLESKPSQLAVAKLVRYSPGLEYDRAILEKG